jgi:hypothetical protein
MSNVKTLILIAAVLIILTIILMFVLVALPGPA